VHFHLHTNVDVYALKQAKMYPGPLAAPARRGQSPSVTALVPEFELAGAGAGCGARRLRLG